MNIIFLDIDGVLNANMAKDSQKKELSDGKLIDDDKVKLLGQLVEKTSAAIVLHSGWKYWFNEDITPLRDEAENLVNKLAATGLKLHDITPDLATDEIKKTKKFSLVKAKEILQWIDNNPVNKWIVIDDLDLHNDLVAKHQIKTDPTLGLTQSDIDAAIKML